jgi:hypothetical protein
MGAAVGRKRRPRRSACRTRRSSRLLEAGGQHQHRQDNGHQKQRRDISPQVPDGVVAEGLHRHDCGVDDAGNHGEPDRAEIGRRVPCRVEQEDAECRVDAHDHHEQVRLVGRAGFPCPPRRPDQGQGIEKESNHANDGERELKKRELKKRGRGGPCRFSKIVAEAVSPTCSFAEFSS